MVFSSTLFLFWFLPVVLIGYYLCGKKAKNYWLLLASLFFYSWGEPKYVLLMFTLIVINYICGLLLARDHNRYLLCATVIFNLGILGYFKYFNFLMETVNAVLSLIGGQTVSLNQIALPIGISFFTFQLIAFLVDSYRGLTKEYNVLDYLLFITFFPQLIVGPIVHHKEMTVQFEDEGNMRLNYKNIALGIFIFAIGLGKKMLLADPLNNNAAEFYGAVGDQVTMWQAWFYTLEYSISYYFDLSGYTDMAIGLGLFFNIRLPENFNAPFRSRNFKEYWQRQHMTLSRFLGGYVFKNVFRKGCKWRNYYVATMATFLVSGIWHGAGWNFIIWGIMNGVLVCISAYLAYHKKEPPFLVGWFFTFIFIVLTRVIFVAVDMHDTMVVYKAMFDVRSLMEMGWAQVSSACLAFGYENYQLMLISLAGLLICWFAPTTRHMADRFKPDVKHFIFTAVLLAVCFARMNQVVEFLYFQF